MLGLNSGLLGVRRVPTTGSASGLWSPNEQSLAKRATIWPTSDDEHWSNVSLLLHMDGSNGSTTFTDSSANNFTITASGNAQITTTDPKFGTGALTLDGTGDYLTLPANSAFQLGTGNFTVECWVYVNSGNTNNGLFTFGTTFAAYIYSGDWYLAGVSMGAVTTGAWQHLAVTRSGSDLRMFIDGTQIGATRTYGTDITANVLDIGWYFSTAYTINAKIDEFRLTKGVARYITNFTAPAAAFPNG